MIDWGKGDAEFLYLFLKMNRSHGKINLKKCYICTLYIHYLNSVYIYCIYLYSVYVYIYIYWLYIYVYTYILTEIFLWLFILGGGRAVFWNRKGSKCKV